MLYDYPTLETENDKTLTEIHAFINRLSTAAVPGASLVDVFPWMMYIPERFVLIYMTFLSLSSIMLHQIRKVEGKWEAIFRARQCHVPSTS